MRRCAAAGFWAALVLVAVIAVNRKSRIIVTGSGPPEPLVLDDESVGNVQIVGSHGQVCEAMTQAGRCKRHGQSYTWCRTTDGQWDYCVAEQETSNGWRCKDDSSPQAVCGRHENDIGGGLSSYDWCRTT